MTYWPVPPDDSIATATIGAGTTFPLYPLETAIGPLLPGADCQDYEFITFMITVTDKSTASTLYVRIYQSVDGLLFSYQFSEGAPAAGVVTLDPLELQIDITDPTESRWPIILPVRGARYVRMSVAADAGTPVGGVTFMRKAVRP